MIFPRGINFFGGVRLPVFNFEKVVEYGGQYRKKH